MSGARRQWLTLVLSAAFAGTGLTTSCLERREGDTTSPRPECSECHGGLLDEPWQAAPPYNLSGEREPEARGNGAHAAHLMGSARARKVACEECHRVPENVDDQGHLDSEYPAEVNLVGPAQAFEAQPKFLASEGRCADTFCHGGYFVGGRPSGGTHPEPLWTDQDDAVASCTGCHGMPPPAPHPAEEQCAECHKNIEPDGEFSRPELHVDGSVNFYLPSR